MFGNGGENNYTYIISKQHRMELTMTTAKDLNAILENTANGQRWIYKGQYKSVCLASMKFTKKNGWTPKSTKYDKNMISVSIEKFNALLESGALRVVGKYAVN